jgi:anaerobic selenocysteine-containing dehydrogenase
VPLDDVRQHRHGAIFSDPDARVLAKEPGWAERLDVGHPAMITELAEVVEEPVTGHGGYRVDEPFAYRLISRRLKHVYNSSGRDIDYLVRDGRHNPAYMHPDDLAAEGLRTGDVVVIDSGHARITAVVEAADDVRPGAISMAHGFGDLPAEDEGDEEKRRRAFEVGASTGRLTAVDRDFDPIHGLPLMSAIPVNIRRLPEPAAVPEPVTGPR